MTIAITKIPVSIWIGIVKRKRIETENLSARALKLLEIRLFVHNGSLVFTLRLPARSIGESIVVA